MIRTIWLAIVLLITAAKAQLLFASKNPVQDKSELHIYIPDSKISDTLILEVWRNTLGSFTGGNMNRYIEHQTLKTSGQNGHFDFTITGITTICYFSLFKTTDAYFQMPLFILENYLVSPGDQVNIRFNPDKRFKKESIEGLRIISNGDLSNYIYRTKDYLITFTGKGCDKYQARYLTDRHQLINGLERKNSIMDQAISGTGVYIRNNYKDSSIAYSMKILDLHKTKMDITEYQVLKCDILSAISMSKWKEIRRTAMNQISRSGSTDGLKKAALICEHKEDSVLAGIPATSLAISNYYAASELQRELAYYTMLANQASLDELDTLLTIVLTKYQGPVKDKMVALFLLSSIRSIKNSSEAFRLAALSVNSQPYNKMIQDLKESQSVGMKAYDFALEDASGKIVQLSDYQGKIVFIDFWYTRCGSCSKFYKETLSQVEAYFKADTSIVFMTICIDSDKKEWIKSINGGLYTSPMAVNLYTGGKGVAHPVIEYYHIYSYPHPLLIDKMGKILKTNSLHTDAEKLIRLIKEG